MWVGPTNFILGEGEREIVCVVRQMEKEEAKVSEEKVTNILSSTSSSSKVCKRCHQTYNPASNTCSSCCFHPSFFVCRRHDDQKRYYELGPDDPPYAAKFYDCCGAEDPNTPGCTTAFHLSYDHHC